MFETLFGAEMPLAVRFFLAFLIVLGLIGVAAWAVRRFGASRLGGGALRGRQPRLAVIDYASVDARRRLILVRRDNVEHLMMIGGPTDVVVEANIVRAAPAARDVPVVRPTTAVETLPRAIPLPEATTNGSGGSWPLQPEPAGAPTLPSRRAPRPEAAAEEAESVTPHSEAASRPQRDALTALADDLATLPMPPAPLRNRAPTPPRPVVAEPHVETRSEPRVPARPAEPEAAAVDQNLAEMAQRLEAALRKPKPTEQREAPAPSAAAPRAAAVSERTADDEAPAVAPAPSPRPARAVEPKPARADAKIKESKLYDTLEQEMASLLGRPAGKT